jgi:hypothetical protein
VNDCVIIPDFGGFVLQTCPAVYAGAAHTFYPPRKEIVFNPALSHNDGLLSGSYMQTYGMNFKEAQSALKRDVGKLKAELDRHSEVSSGRIGSLRKTEGVLIFQPGADVSLFSVSSYGLDPFYLPPVAVRQPAEPANVAKPGSQSGRVIYLPVHRMAIRIAGMVAAAIILFLFVSPPVEDVNPDSYTAGFIPSEMIPGKITPPESSAVPLQIPDEPATAENPPASMEAETPAVVKSSSRPDPEMKAAGQKTYYIIIGSFETERQANRFVSETTNTSGFKNAGIVKYNKNIRVYADKYDNRKDAEEYMYLLRANEKYKNAWLFIGR